MSGAVSSLHLFAPPYRKLTEVEDPSSPMAGIADPRGSALVWRMGARPEGEAFEGLCCRPGGVPLIVLLPQADELERPDDVLRVVELCRPHSVLPSHDRSDARELREVLARPPEDLAVEIGDYLAWRGIILDSDTRRIVRRIVELSSELRTVSALARSLYLSRRALGRRFMHRGLPVPSHWLQACRLLRASIRLQTTEENVFVVAGSRRWSASALSSGSDRSRCITPAISRC